MANLKTGEKKTKAQSMGLHTEVLTGKTQQKFFNPDEAENFYYFGTYDVDFNKRTEIDVKDMDCSCLLYTSPSPRDQRGSRMPSSA